MKNVFSLKGKDVFFGTITISSPLTYPECDEEERSERQIIETKDKKCLNKLRLRCYVTTRLGGL